MRKPGLWWRRKTTPQKVETYTRWSFHFFATIEIFTLGIAPFGSVPQPRAGWLFLMVCAHAVLSGITASRALDWTRGTRGIPRRAVAVLGAVTAVMAVSAFALAYDGSEDPGRFATVLTLYIGVLSFGAGTIALVIRTKRRMFALVCGAAVGAGAVVLGFTGNVVLALATVFGAFLSCGALTATAGFSVWLLNAVYELDDARETRARLAVAEERLRFGRDLHDIIGRNLAVIALKSELAVQLTRRERPEAEEQMIEVQRIARESQREVREVVRGYREADLASELAGAQSVLTAAGIVCEFTGTATGLPPAVQSTLAWVVRETTTNVLRHGDASRCAVALEEVGGVVRLTVESDGVPLAGARSSGGTGLAGLRERLGGVGGTLTAGAEGRVFRVVAEVPVASGGGGIADREVGGHPELGRRAHPFRPAEHLPTTQAAEPQAAHRETGESR
ncbi:sensor histidine kinase [Streptomyces sp. NPDC058001]|uniref:sensor histidine kinase n=1 Tax=Streptomyces sp. NPDC058001 TaxID=3346300 RepID=UPI0036EDE1E7